MTTTSQHPPAGDPGPTSRQGGGPEGGARPSGVGQGGRPARGGVLAAVLLMTKKGVKPFEIWVKP